MSPSTFASHHRVWGTRFDALSLNSPSPSPPPTPSLLVSVEPSDGEANTPKTDFAELQEPSLVPEAALPRKQNRLPQDASVFVGSLPGHVDQSSLARLLSEHLSSHTQVQNVKVVRDGKGGICAFIQCEDAHAACRLLEELHTGPKRQFLGRYLRYEAARAFRTLLISYRKPLPTPVPGSPAMRAMVELPLPYAMRMWKSPGSKLLSVVYNDEARELNHNGINDETREDDDVLTQPGFFIDSMNFDAEMIMSLTLAFGPLEHFGLFVPTASNGHAEGHASSQPAENYVACPPTHRLPRAAGMDPGCWRVKWERRTNAVAALTTLRRIPFLNVTWAHHTNPPSARHDHAHHPPAYAHPGLRFVPGEQAHFGGLLTPSSSFGMPTLTTMDDMCTPEDVGGGMSVSYEFPPLSPVLGEVMDSAMPASLWGDIPQTASEDVVQVSILAEDPVENLWSDQAYKGSPNPRDWRLPTPHPSMKSLAARQYEEWHNVATHILPPPAAQPLRVGIADGQGEAREAMAPPPSASSVCSLPELSYSPITPRTPAHSLLHTPAGRFKSLPVVDEISVSGQPSHTGDGGDSLDPTSIFVGGLDPPLWDEERVRALFLKYGGVEEVRVVKPTHQKSAFAFVKFDSIEAPSKAVVAEHNQLYSGRPIRVQIRSLNPPPAARRYGAGFGNHGRGSRFGATYGSPRNGLRLEVGPANGQQSDAVTRPSGQDNGVGDDQSAIGGRLAVSTAPAENRYVGFAGAPSMGSPPAVITSPYNIPPLVTPNHTMGWAMPYPRMVHPYPVYYPSWQPQPGAPMFGYPAAHMGPADSAGTGMGAPQHSWPIAYGHLPFPQHSAMGTSLMPPAGASGTEASQPHSFVQNPHGPFPIHQPPFVEWPMVQGGSGPGPAVPPSGAAPHLAETTNPRSVRGPVHPFPFSAASPAYGAFAHASPMHCQSSSRGAYTSASAVVPPHLSAPVSHSPVGYARPALTTSLPLIGPMPFGGAQVAASSGV